MAYRTGGGFVGALVGIKDMIQGLFPGGRDAARKVCGVVQNVFFRVGSAVVGIAAAVFSGGGSLSATTIISTFLQTALIYQLEQPWFWLCWRLHRGHANRYGSDSRGSFAQICGFGA